MRIIEENRLNLDWRTSSEIDRVLKSEKSDFTTLLALTSLDPKTDFRYCDLAGMDFSYANLSGFDFTGSDLRGALMRDTNIDATTVMDKCDLSGADFNSSHFNIDERSITEVYRGIKSIQFSKYIEEIEEHAHLLRRPLMIGPQRAIGDMYARKYRYTEIVDKIPKNPLAISWLVMMSAYSNVDRMHISEVLASSFSNANALVDAITEVLLDSFIPYSLRIQICSSLFSHFGDAQQREYLHGTLTARGVPLKLVNSISQSYSKRNMKDEDKRVEDSESFFTLEGQGYGPR